jgi:hypothetical protein
MSSRFILAACILATIMALSACMSDIPMVRAESAQRAAAPVFMIPRIVPADPFTLQAYERVHQKFAPAILYIEGDGAPYATGTITNFFNTPTDPVGIRLAAQDGSTNVLYLARPCQYRQKFMGSKDCPQDFWTTHRFAPEVLQAYNNALDNMKKYHDITGFHIVGFDGGGAIAALLAAQRNDILTLRTVAGNLDPDVFARVNNITFLEGSLNPVNYAEKLSRVPQRHYVGKLDRVMPPAVYASYAQRLQRAGGLDCTSVTLVDNADHERGWVEQWRVLKDLPATCNAPAADPAPVPFDPRTLDGDKGLGPK